MASLCIEGGGFLDSTLLPVTGTYTLVVDPQTTATGSTTLTLYDIPDVTGTLTINGGTVPVTIASPGQNAKLTFSGTQGQQVTVRLTGSTLYYPTVALLKPDNSTLTSAWSGNPNFNLSTQTLPSTGTYTVLVDPWVASTGSINVAVTSP